MSYHEMVMILRKEILSRIPHKVYPNFDEDVMERLIKIYEIIMRGING
jgi:hypothetical protein